MFIEATKLLNLPIASEESMSKIGIISEIIVDPENGVVCGLQVKPLGLFSPKKVLSVVDILAWDPNGIVTRDEENLVDASEIVRIEKILEKQIFLIGLKAETENGKNLGQVEDFLIDTETQTVSKYYLKNLFGESLILGHDKVVRIDKKIIFTDDVGEGETSPGMEVTNAQTI